MNSAILFTLASLFVVGLCVTPCPYIPTVANFDVAKFSGQWRSIQESDEPRLPCLHYIVKGYPNNNVSVTFLLYNIEATTSPKNSKNISDGFIVSMPLPKLNGASMNVFATDYQNYAGIFTCKQTDTVSYYSVTFWSRTDSLTSQQISDLKAVLDNYGVKYETLQPIKRETILCKAFDLGGTIVKPFLDLFMNWLNQG